MASDTDSPLATLGRIPGATGAGGGLVTLPWSLNQLTPQPPGVVGWGRMSLFSDPNLLAQNGLIVPMQASPPAQANAAAPLTEPGIGSTSKLPQAMQSQVQKLDRTPTKLDLFDSTTTQPSPDDVRQGFVGDCPVPATLIAMAGTPTGRTKITAMIQSLTVKALASKESNGTMHTTDRKLQVTFASGTSVDITDYVYLNGYVTSPGVKSTGNLEMVFTRSDGNPTSGVMWPSFIEKAYVVLKGSDYDVLDGRDVKEVMNDLWGSHIFAAFDMGKKTADITTGGKTTYFDFSKKGDKAKFDAALLQLLNDVAKKPTIAGSLATTPNSNIEPGHAYAIEGFANKQVQLVNPHDPTAPGVKPRKIQLKYDDFLANFGELLQGV
jgi:hypothetical protein